MYVLVMPSLFGKSTLALNNNLFFDVDDAMQQDDVKEEMKGLRREALETNWDKHNLRYGDIAREYFEHMDEGVILLHSHPASYSMHNMFEDVFYMKPLVEQEFKLRLDKRLATIPTQDRDTFKQLARMNLANHKQWLQDVSDDKIIEQEDIIPFFENLIDN